MSAFTERITDRRRHRDYESDELGTLLGVEE
jgi:hypothetical protein